ncbi:3-oxoacyl-[acyl-carrier protein] reductase [Kushneria sinocarnis]|uniref:3-oxoacyl-[acyl-carrier protein] reductase n=1 Tax=Kushneria sinocarnis TaxID=595502 RepID=A0A420WSF6_9GAMM|nr:3-oxoacyl-ACP reductase family protein [Kushneria sinocarnis]RKQ95700.1 3-oxoacyl-[acyl-carrier protein] reductase [Kushneria sinocarnis]
MDDLTGRIALVTGGSRGIGHETAVALARAGCDVAINFLHSDEAAEAVVNEIEAQGRRALAVRADVAVGEEVNRLVDEVEAQLGGVDILVNNAGINPIYPLDEIDEARWQETLQVNLTSAFLASQRVIPGMRDRGWGRVIMMSSIAAQFGGVIGPHYAASKAGMLGLMRSYAGQLADQGVTANAIAPALIETDMIRDNPNITPELLPVKRFGRCDEVAETVLLMARNGYINGQTFNLNGGWVMS